MKKSSLLIIIVVYLVSIVAISFFGQEIEMSQFMVRVTSLEISNETEIVPGSDNIRNINLPWDEENGYSWVMLNYTYEPSNADNPSVNCYLSGDTAIDADSGEEVTIAFVVEDYREIVFLRPGIVTAYLTTIDGSNITDSVRITCR